MVNLYASRKLGSDRFLVQRVETLKFWMPFYTMPVINQG